MNVCAYCLLRFPEKYGLLLPPSVSLGLFTLGLGKRSYLFFGQNRRALEVWAIPRLTILHARVLLLRLSMVLLPVVLMLASSSSPSLTGTTSHRTALPPFSLVALRCGHETLPTLQPFLVRTTAMIPAAAVVPTATAPPPVAIVVLAHSCVRWATRRKTCRFYLLPLPAAIPFRSIRRSRDA
jgi:hypothetical protein